MIVVRLILLADNYSITQLHHVINEISSTILFFFFFKDSGAPRVLPFSPPRPSPVLPPARNPCPPRRGPAPPFRPDSCRPPGRRQFGRLDSLAGAGSPAVAPPAPLRRAPESAKIGRAHV